jgi:hypothetical protein
MCCLQCVLLVFAAAVAGCATTPPAPEVGQTPEQVAEQQSNFTLELQFIQDGSTFAVGTAFNGENSWRSSIVFIDGRVACSFSTKWAALLDWRWVSQPDGLEYLAAQLRGACGLADNPPERFLTDAMVPVPEALPKVAESGDDSKPPSGAQRGVVEVLATSLGIVLSPVILAAGIPTLAVGGAMGHGLEGKRARIRPGMPGDEAEKILGTPTARFNLAGSATEVLAYLSAADAVSVSGSLAMASSWYVGVRDEQVIWTHRNDDWLVGLAEQAISQAKKKP